MLNKATLSKSTDFNTMAASQNPWKQSLRKSTNNLATTVATAAGDDLSLVRSSKVWSNIENEYIKNLQQQLHFLEMENKYLREQMRNASEMQPKMVDEASNMLDKLRRLESEMNGIKAELTRQTARADSLQYDKELLQRQLTATRDKLTNEKEGLTSQLFELRLQNDTAAVQLDTDEGKISFLQDTLSKQKTASDTATEFWAQQVEELSQQNRLLHATIENKNNVIIDKEARIIDLEQQLLTAQNISKLVSTVGADNSNRLLSNDLITAELRKRELLATKSALLKQDATMNRSLDLLRGDVYRNTLSKGSLLAATLPGTSQDPIKLRKDKEILIDHVTQLEKSTSSKDREIAKLKRELTTMKRDELNRTDTRALRDEMRSFLDD